MRSFIPWVGGKGKLLWLLRQLAPPRYDRFVDVFGGSGTVLLDRPLQKGCVEVYNDYNSDLVNLFRCVKERPLALLQELGFLPLHSREGFGALEDFLAQKEFADPFLPEELAIAEQTLAPPEAETVRDLLLQKAAALDVRRAAAYFKLIRCSFSGTGNSFGARPANIRNAFGLIWACSRRLADVVIENKDFESLIGQYGQPGTFLYCDPPYYQAECYEVAFPRTDHARLYEAVARTPAYVMVSYNDCAYIRRLYQDFWIWRTVRPNSMSQTAGSEYCELVMTNYDPRAAPAQGWQISMYGERVEDGGRYQLVQELEDPPAKGNIPPFDPKANRQTTQNEEEST